MSFVFIYMPAFFLPCSLLNLVILLVLMQMSHSLLSALHKDSNRWAICVLVSHMWHYQGGTDEGPIEHTVLVLLVREVSAATPNFLCIHGTRVRFLVSFFRQL
jgi:hypothetical protein